MKDSLRNYLHGTGTLDAVRTPADFEALCAAVEADGAGRLRWKLGRRLGLPPFAGTPGRDEYLYACAQLWADRQEALSALCPKCRARALREACPVCGGALPTENPAFDENRYEELKQHDTSL